MREAGYWTQRTAGRSSRRRVLGVAAGTGLAGLWLAACGGSGSAGKEQPARPATGGTVAPGEQPVAGGTLTALQTRDAASLDPLASQIYTTPERIGLVYPRLFYYDRDEQADFTDSKLAASYITEKWELSGDGTTLTFRLRQGVKYSNTAPVNGRELVAEDVKFSFERYRTDPTSAFKARYADITGIETPDKHTVVFKLKAPSSYLAYALAAEPSFITPPEVAQQHGDYKQVLVGPGPFLHEKTAQGEGSSFRKNPDFVDAARIYYDRYEIKVIADTSTRMAALRTGQADFVTGTSGFVAKSDWQTVTRGNQNLASAERPPLGSSGLWFNLKNPRWKDPRARKAISRAINRQEIIDRLMEGAGVFSGAIPVGFGKWAYTDEQMRTFDAYKFDPAAAKQLWAAAGAPATSIQFHIPPKQNVPLYTDMGEMIGQQLKTHLGLEVEFTSEEYSGYINKVYNNRFPDIAMGFMSLFDPLDYLLAQYYPGGARNGPGLDDPKLNGMLDDLRGTLDESARVKKALDIQKYIHEDVISMAHLPQRRTYELWNSRLRRWLSAVRPPGIEFTLSSWKAK